MKSMFSKPVVTAVALLGVCVAVSACSLRGTTVSSDHKHIVVEAGKNSQAIADKHCAKYGKEAFLKDAEPLSGKQVYWYDCVTQ
ncbi:MAG: hypothetical protein ACPGOV_16955 [Magnetovibrionaceae bacterium]